MGSNAGHWLEQLCEAVSGATRGVLILDARSGGPAALHPAGTRHPKRLANLARAALQQRSVLAEESPPAASGERGHLWVAVPLSFGEGQTAAVGLEVADRKEAEAAPIVASVRASARWLDASGAGHEDLLVDLVGIGLERPGLRAAATALTTELATRLRCERVSLGFREGGESRIEAISHTARLPSTSRLMADLAETMDEACDQDTALRHPPGDEEGSRILRCQRRLCERHGTGAVCTVPFAGETEGAIAGALVFERKDPARFEDEDMSLCEATAALVGSLLLVRRQAEAGPLPRARAQLREAWSRLVGPDQLRLKAFAALGLPLLLLLSFVQAPYRVTSAATLEGRVQRAVVAGLEGFVAESSARAGDLVSRGQHLARIDDRDLKLEQRKWQGRFQELRREYREALAGHDRSRVNILGARIAQAEAQLALLDEQLARTALRAPFAGIVIRGDLSQSLGSPVKKGDVLFEVAPLDGYRIILQVDERDIADVAPNQRGELALSALPGQALPLTVERVTPVASAEEGANHFRVEARLDEPIEALRPGMAGIAKIDVAKRSLIWIATHRTIDWLRLWAWSWWP